MNAQEIKTKFLGTNEGLSQGSNYFRYEDSLGFMWISANDAVNRYDGSQVKVYNLNRYFDNCPNLAQAYGIVEDNKTNIYFGSTNGMYCYSRQKGVFNLITIYSKKNNQLTMPFGFWNNKIWCFNNKYEIVSYDVNSKKITSFAKLDLPDLPSVHVYNLNFSKTFYQGFPFIDKKNTAWFSIKNKVVALNLKSKLIELPLVKIISENKLEINSSYLNNFTNEIIFATNKGILTYQVGINKVFLTKSISDFSLKNTFTAISNQEILAVFQMNHLTIINIKSQKIIYQNSKNSAFYKFGFDKNKRLWFCDDGKGQTIFDFNATLLQKATSENTFTGKNFNGIASINPINENEILINSNSVWNKKTKTLANSLKKFDIQFSFRTSYDYLNNGIWLYNDASKPIAEALFFMDKNQKITPYFKKQDLSNLGIIQDIKPITDNKILLACEKGLFWFNKVEKKIKPIPNQTQNNAFYISPLSNNRFAISYINHNMLLARVDEQSNLIFEKNILPKKQSFYMQEDKQKQQFWVGTNNGLFLLDNNFKILKTFDANSGMAGTYIYGLLLDDNQTIWTSHQRGLSSINTKTHQVINYDLNDGVQDWDFNNRAFCKTSDGTLYFGGARGFNYFKPPIKFSSNYKPKIYIDEIKINDKVYHYQENADYLSRLNLSSEENNISIKTSILDIQNAKSYKIAYRLNHSKWNIVSNYWLIEFNSLSPQKYNLELGVYDKFTDKVTVQKSIFFTIEAPFYSTIWFWTIISVLITGLLFYLYNQRKLIRQKRIFDQQLQLEQQRNQITADLHDDIGATLSSLQLNSAVANQLIKKDIGKTENLLEKIENQSKDLADKIGDIIWSMKPGKNEFMTLSSRIKNFSNDILGATSSDYSIEIDEEIDDLIKDISVRKNLILIAKEAVNNCAKYSKAKNITISIKKLNSSIELSIQDNGIGFDSSIINGNGISNMQKRASEIKSKFSIESTKNSGTKILLQIPYPYI